MSALTPARLTSLTDQLAGVFLQVVPNVNTTPTNSTVGLGSSATTPGSSTDYGTHYAINVMLNTVLAYADYDANSALMTTIDNALVGASFQSWANNLAPIISSLNNYCASPQIASSVININSFASYYNTGAGGTWTCLLAPDFNALYLAVSKVSLTNLNVYSPPITNMGTMVFPSTFTAGTAVNASVYAGAATLVATVTSFAGTSGTLTVTGTNQLGTSGRTWTVTVAANGTFTLIPTIATDMCISVQSVAQPNMTGGTVVISAAPPAGRVYPPV